MDTGRGKKPSPCHQYAAHVITVENMLPMYPFCMLDTINSNYVTIAMRMYQRTRGESKTMSDYLNGYRPKKPSHEVEHQRAIAARQCKSCASYTFYHCNALNQYTAPDAICTCPQKYVTKPCYVE